MNSGVFISVTPSVFPVACFADWACRRVLKSTDTVQIETGAGTRTKTNKTQIFFRKV